LGGKPPYLKHLGLKLRGGKAKEVPPLHLTVGVNGGEDSLLALGSIGRPEDKAIRLLQLGISLRELEEEGGEIVDHNTDRGDLD